MCVSRSAVIAFVALDFADLDHLGDAIRALVSIAKRQNSNVLIMKSNILGFDYLSHVRMRRVGSQGAKIDDLEILRLDHSPAAIELPSAASRLLARLSLHVIRPAYPEASDTPLGCDLFYSLQA